MKLSGIAVLLGLASPAFAQDLPPLTFSNADSLVHEYAFQTFSAVAPEPIERDAVWIGEIDLDLDGDLDFVAFGIGKGFCDAGGCLPYAFESYNGDYTEMSVGRDGEDTRSLPDYWSSPGTLVNGHRVLHLEHPEYPERTADYIYEFTDYVRAP